jgi:hypothetical protein
MNCEKIIETVYDYSGGESMPLSLQIRIALHTLFCSECEREIERFRLCREVLKEDFFPPSPALEDSIMLACENEIMETGETQSDSGELSMRGWAIAGIVILFSLMSAFFGYDFNRMTSAAGTSLLLPVGIVIGIFLTVYGALFIGSHLKELSERFGL